MKKQMFGRDEKGFSLVELMIVVGIIGVLATLALPRFKQFQAKAKMGEAKNILSHIYTLEQSYGLDSNRFVNFTNIIGRQNSGAIANCGAPAAGSGEALIGFRLDPCVNSPLAGAGPTPRYGYTVVGASASAFTAQAISGNMAGNVVCPNNPTHTFTLDAGNNFVDQPVGTACPN